MSTPEFSTFERALDQKAHDAAREMRRARAENTASASLADNLPLLWIVPSLSVAIGLVAWASNHRPELMPPSAMLLLMLLAPLAKIVWDAAWAYRAPASKADALLAFDEQVGARGSLIAAYEFLQADSLDAFECATVEDARGVLDRNHGAELALEKRGPILSEQSAPHFVAAALLLVVHALLFWHFHSPAPSDPRTPVAALQPDAPDATDITRDGGQTEANDQAGAAETLPTPKDAPPANVAPKTPDPSAKLPDSMLPSAGETGQGKSSDAQTQSSPSESRGAPSGQSPAPPKEKAPPQTTQKETQKKPSADDQRRAPKPEEEEGGASAGRGSAKGSNRNTTTSKWTGKDQVTTPDEQEIEEDEDTDDESEEQKNRGGMQPNLRDRRPPVSRDLRIGFGNQPNPDANGRGGPSEAKKSRGTASLVLGVPIPDRIKGQPNPGPTRITQERIEPTAEDGPDRQTETRRPRTNELGPLVRPEPSPKTTQLVPWQRQLIRRFLDERRTPQP